MTASLLSCVSPGACGVSVPHHFHGGGFPQGNSLRPALPPQRLPEERLESAGLHHRGRRVSSGMQFEWIEEMINTARPLRMEFAVSAQRFFFFFFKGLPTYLTHLKTSGPQRHIDYSTLCNYCQQMKPRPRQPRLMPEVLIMSSK